MFLYTAFLLSASIVLGGGTRSGFIGDVILQVLAVPLLAVALAKCWRVRPLLVALPVGCILAIAVLQLTPWPWPLQTNFITELAARGLTLIGEQGSWTYVSIVPNATAAALVSILPALAIFYATVLLDHDARIKLVWVIVFWGGASVLLGFLQVAQGPSSSLRFFEITNPTEAVGFFANRNHFAALMYVTLLFAVVAYIDLQNQAAANLTGQRGRSKQSAQTVALVGLCLMIVATVAGAAMARSRAGIVLMMIAGVGAALVAVRYGAFDGSTPGSKSRLRSRAVTIAIVGAILFAAQFGLYRFISRFEADPFDDARWGYALATYQAAIETMPFATGLGSFVPVFASLEPLTVTSAVFSNRAHNDPLENFAEMGLVAPILLLGMLTSIAYVIANGARMTERAALQVAAAFVSLVMITLHSLVDYPLRTAALLACSAIAFSMMIPPMRRPNLEPNT